MTENDRQIGEEFVKLALAINEYLQGYVDSYFGPDTWRSEAQQAGKIPLPDLARRAELLENSLLRPMIWIPSAGISLPARRMPCR